MKATSNSAQTMQQLSSSLVYLLNLYALSATAAGVASLALAQPAEAKIVYTPAHIRLLVNRLTELDLDHDGTKDFQFRNLYGSHRNSTLSIIPAQSSNRVWAGSCTASIFKTSHCALPLSKGRTIGPRSPFEKNPSSLLMVAYQANTSQAGTYFGGWARRDAYLGLKFVIKGKTHFGWARVRMHGRSKGFFATIIGYAYETIPNKAIVTGTTKGQEEKSSVEHLSPASLAVTTRKPATLGLLALGYPSGDVRCREQNQPRHSTLATLSPME
jgi:hypothetical protein